MRTMIHYFIFHLLKYFYRINDVSLLWLQPIDYITDISLLHTRKLYATHVFLPQVNLF